MIALKNKYIKYLDSVRDKGTWMSPILQEEVTRQKTLANKTTTLQQLATVSTVPSWFTGTNFSGIYPLDGEPETHLNFDFMSSQTGWVGIYGQTKNYRLTFGIFRNTLSPSVDGSASIMSFFGGIGWKDDKGHENWVPFKTLFVGIPPYFSQTDKSITVTIDSNNWFKIDLDSTPVFSGKVTIDKGPTCLFNASPNTKAIYNGKDGCVPICFGGVGTNYWSFTDLKLEINVIPPLEHSTDSETGLGWFDHQWISSGVPRGLVDQIVFGLLNKGNIKVGMKWIWLAMQKTDDLIVSTEQYAGSVFFKSNVKKGDVINGSFVHYVNGKVVNYTEQSTVTIMGIFQGYPVILHVKIGDVEFDISPLGDAINNVQLINDTQNWEGPSTIMQGKTKWGVGFMEVNNMKPGNTGIEDVLKSQNLITKPLFYPQYVSMALPVLIFVITIIVMLISVSVLLIVKWYKHRRNKMKDGEANKRAISQSF